MRRGSRLQLQLPWLPALSCRLITGTKRRSLLQPRSFAPVNLLPTTSSVSCCPPHHDTMRPTTQSRHRSLPATAIIPTLLSISTLLQSANANPFPKDDLHNTLSYGFLQDPMCASYCGVENEHCCSGGEVCVTSDSIAGCATVTVATKVATIFPRQEDSWSYYTSTWTETETFTSTFSSYWGGASATATCVAQSEGETSCGAICCASDQYCAYAGQCSAVAGGGGVGATTTAATATSWTTYATTMTTAGSTITTQYSAPYRVTGTGSTSTSTGTMESATSTGSGNGTVVSEGTGGSNLSGGAIAGIVIGVLAGVVLLLAICACCIMRGLWHGLLALLGLGPKKRDRNRDRETVIVEEERYSRRGSSHANRNSHNSWFARNPARSTAGESRRTSEKVREKDSNQASWWGAGALGTLLLLLGLRRDKKRRSSTAAKRSSRARSEVSSSYFSDSYTASSPSEFSSDYTYSSVYTPVQSHHPRGASRPPSVVRSQVRAQSVARSVSRGGGESRYREEYEPMTKPPPNYAGSASSGGRTRDTRRSRRTETTRISRAPSRR